MSTADIKLDAKGLACPLPLLKAKQALNTMQVGQCLEVLATDAGSWRDIAVFVEHSDHRLLERCEQDGVYTYLIEKG